MKKDIYTRLFDTGVFPVLDRLNGTRIAPILTELLRSEHLDQEEIKQRQDSRLDRIIALAEERSDFYREVWSESKRAGPPSDYSSLSGLPIITKSDLVAAASSFPLPSFKGRIVSSHTSGSTGSPMVFYRSAEQESWFWALRFRIWRWGGYHPGDRYLTINLNPRKLWKKRLQDQLFRCTYLTFNADNQDSQRIVDSIKSKRIPFINGFSSSLYVLSRYIIETGQHDLGIRGVTSTGDSLFPSYRESIEAACGVRVLDYYGAGGEGVHLASQCPDSKSRYHLHPENTVVEILSKDGPVGPGERGKIVITQLNNDAMPLIRYDLEDVAVQTSNGDPCPCGRTLPMLDRVEGRVPDLVLLPDGTFLVMHFFVVLFKQLQGIDRYQIVQSEPERVLVRLVGRPGVKRQLTETTIRQRIANASRDLLGCDFEWVDTIPLSGAGKRRLVISEISRRALGIQTIASAD